MSSITTISQTIFKKFPKQSNQLSGDEKSNVEINRKIEYQSLVVEDGHYYVELKEPILPVGKKGFFILDMYKLKTLMSLFQAKLYCLLSMVNVGMLELTLAQNSLLARM